MKVNIKGKSINIVLPSDVIPEDKIPIIFLHGFTGSATDWEFIMQNISLNYFPIAVDLPGHGETAISDELDDYSIESINDIITNLIKHLNLRKVVLVGYSMGGRAALSFALENQALIKALILESTNPGIKDIAEREERYNSDLALADNIEIEGIEKFINYWMERPLFWSLKNLPKSVYQTIVLKKKMNNKAGLANALRGFSTGKMKNYWNEVSNLYIPTLLVAGLLDKKYLQISQKMGKLIPRSEHFVVDKAGHNVHLEKPKEFIKLVNNFLDRL